MPRKPDGSTAGGGDHLRVPAVNRYLDALTERLESGPSSANWRETRQAIAEHLGDYLAGRIGRVDSEILTAILIAIRQCEAKEVPELFTPAPRARGESLEGAALRACIEAAGTYIVFCTTHKDVPGIDQAPVITVCEAFSVHRATASRWKARARKPALGERVARMPLAAQFKFLATSMRASGRQYARFGGASSAAVRSRAGGSAK